MELRGDRWTNQADGSKQARSVRAGGVHVIRNAAVSVCLVLGGSFFAAVPALADPGDGLAVRMSTPSTVGANPGSTHPWASFVDEGSGRSYKFNLRTNEGNDSSGTAYLLLRGPSISVCTTHGGSTEAWRDQNSDPSSPTFSGNSPLTEISCGTAFGQAVTIKGCIAKLEAHGFVHADFKQPIVYAGMTTIDVRYEKKSRSPDEIHITIYTPKDKIKLSGKVTADTVTMPSCQNTTKHSD